MNTRTVVCFGDSNTHGTIALTHPLDMRRYGPDIRWPTRMAAALGPDWHVIEEGQPGRSAVVDDPVEGIHKTGIRVLPALLETHRPIDLVIVMLGTNDLKMRFSLPASDIAISVGRLLLMIGQSNAGPAQAAPRALLVSPVPIEETGFLGEMFTGGAVKSRKLAPYYQAIAARHGAGFFDAGSVAAVDPVDGIHLLEDGHAAIGAGLAQTVQGIFDA